MTLAKVDGLSDDFENFKDGTVCKWLFWDETTVLHVNFVAEQESNIEINSVDKSRAKKLKKDFEKLLLKRSSRPGRVHLLEQTKDGIQISELGKGGNLLLRENYEESCVKRRQERDIKRFQANIGLR